MIAKGAAPPNASLRGFYDDALLRADGKTSTGFPRVPVVCTGALATWATQSGVKRIRLANVSPGEASLDGYTNQGVCGWDANTPTTEAGAPSEDPTEGPKVRQARKMVRQAKEAMADAEVAKVRHAQAHSRTLTRPPPSSLIIHFTRDRKSVV